MKAEALSSILEGFDGGQTVVLSAEARLTVDQLLENADALFRRSSVTSGSRIALCGLAVFDLITALAAFDGRAGAMLLLPASADSASGDRLVLAAGCTHRMDGEGIRALPDCREGSGSADADATQWLLATSGTTGVPKLIGHTLASLSRTVKRDVAKGRGFIWGLLYDPCRFAGLQVILQALLSGSMLSVSSSHDFNRQVEGLVAGGVNALSATPSLLRKLLMAGDIKECPLRQITLGGEIADQQILDGLRHCFPSARIVHIYASTEAGVGFSVHDGMAGFPAAWLEDERKSVPMKVRGDGHLLVRPTTVPEGEEVAGRLDADGYLDTGDLVCVAGDRVFFSGRASGSLNVGGNKVMPEYVEEHIRRVDGVFDVYVYGKKSSMMGQIVAADIVLDPGVDKAVIRGNILSYCRSALENWQIPGVLRFVSGLEETAAGKRERLI
jgi:acyl-coenzyme A synthetase/AMP-(fatty) acid ligase